MLTAKIMIVQDSVVVPVVEHSLHDFDLVEARNIATALDLAKEQSIDIFILGIHFDESRALELVNALRATEKYAQTPILLTRLLSTPMAEFLRATVKGYLRAGVISDYLELDHDDSASEKIRQAVLRLIG